MKISARIQNAHDHHSVSLNTNDHVHTLTISPKSNGFGSSVNGGELLFLALATCYCNDIYREAAKQDIRVESVEVEVSGEFGAEGEGASTIVYHAKIAAHTTEEVIRALGNQTDSVAEIQNTLRAATSVRLTQIEPVAL